MKSTNLIFKKKAINPIISVVLIIVVVIVITTVFLNWGELFVNNAIDDIGDIKEFKDIDAGIYFKTKSIS